MAYVSVANKYLVQQLEWLQAMNNRGKGSDESGEGGLIGQQALLENIKYEDALLQLLVGKPYHVSVARRTLMQSCGFIS